MARRKTERKVYRCAECGEEMTGAWAVGFELTHTGECAEKNKAKWRAKSAPEPTSEQVQADRPSPGEAQMSLFSE